MNKEAPEKKTIHDETEEKPIFGADSYSPQTTPSGNPADPRGDVASGDSSDPRAKKSLTDDQLSNKEAGVGDSLKDKADSAEKDSLFTGEEKPGRASRFRGKFTRKRVATIAIASTLGFGGFAGFAVLQGPFQFIHFAQNIQKHFRGNEDFGNDRTSKVLIYALAGRGAQNGRLGVIGNFSANKWEAKLLKETGMRPAYSDPGRRFVGFEIVDDNKAFRFLDNIDANLSARNTKKIQGLMGDKAEIVKANNVRNSGDTKLNIVNSDGRVSNSANIVSFAKQGLGDRRVWIKTMGRAMTTHNVVGSMGSRLLVKRAGVNFHPLNKLKGKSDDAIVKFLAKRKGEISDGAKVPGDLTVATQTDANGKPIPADTADVGATEESKSFIDEFKQSGVFKTTTSAAVIIGVLCAARSFGSSIEDYKYQNNVLPMIRTGINATATGNQVMSGNGFDLDSLKVMSEFMYDKQKKSSAFQAESVIAEQGGTGGTPPPKEADLRNVTDKPAFFDILDNIPFLDTTCSAQQGFFGLPVIKQITGVISSVTTGSLDLILKPFNSSTDELMQSALKSVAGESVDPNAKGAPFGHFANAGTFLAANDAIDGMGGLALTGAQVVELNNLESVEDQNEISTRSIFARYLDPFDSATLSASIIDSSPLISVGVPAFKNPFLNISKSFASLGNTLFSQKVSAQSAGYDYGVPKHGFSLDEQRDSKFENPYDNAVIVEPQLDVLNERYGKCFGMKITVDDTGVHLDNGETVNTFTEEYKNDCKKTNDEMYLRYRFYVADSVTAVSLACYMGEADDLVAQRACAELGTGAAITPDSAGTSPVSGNAQMLETITVSVGAKFITLPSRYSCPGRTTEIDARIAPALTYILDTYNLCADDGLANGHRSHGAGLGVDVRPKDQSKQMSKDEWKATAETAIRDINWWGDAADAGKVGGCAHYSGYGSCVGGAMGPSGKIPGWIRWIGYNGDVDHGDPWHIFGGSYAHIHIGWDTPNNDGVAASKIGTPRSEVFTFPAPIADDLRPLLPPALLNGVQ